MIEEQRTKSSMLRSHGRHAAFARTVMLVAALAALSVCALAVFKRDSASCRSNLKQYTLAILMYSQDYDEMLPPMKQSAKLQNVVLPYCKNKAIFSCPDSGVAYLPNPAMHQVHQASIKSPATTILLRDAKPHMEAGKSVWNVAYADGHVKQVNKEPVLGKAPAAPRSRRKKK